jgi:hypothetical protein
VPTESALLYVASRSSPPKPLRRTDRRLQSAKPKNRHLLSAEFPALRGWDLGEFDCTRAYRVINQESRLVQRGPPPRKS